MSSLTPAQLQRLKTLLALPTAPFREQHIARHLRRLFETSGVPCFTDPVGNLVVGVASPAAYAQLLRKAEPEPLRVFIAHMDHPGFHAERWLAPDRLQVKWHGGSPVKHLENARVWLANDESRIGTGHLQRVELLKSYPAIEGAEVVVEGGREIWSRYKPADLFGGFVFSRDVRQSGKRIYARAVDDLAGVFTIAELALAEYAGGKKSRRPRRFVGLLTRGEEVGFVGAIGHLEQGWLQAAQRTLICISLEASRTLPKAEIGKGPVVRLGDRRTIFNADATQVLTQLAEQLLPGHHQRRIMDGGSCEATATTAYGLPTLGLSIPLGNYHNQGLEGGIDCPNPDGPAPEFGHLSDIAGLFILCQGLLKPGLPWSEPWRDVRRRLLKNFRHYKSHL